MPVAEIFAGVSGLKAVMDTLKTFKDINDSGVRNAIAIELQEKVLSAYQSQSALAEKVGELEKEMAALKDWYAEKAKYKLTEVGQSALAYAPKEGEKTAEPSHYLCANCYGHGEPSILQPRQHSVGRAKTLDCHRCKSYIVVWGVLPDGTKNWL